MHHDAPYPTRHPLARVPRQVPIGPRRTLAPPASRDPPMDSKAPRLPSCGPAAGVGSPRTPDGGGCRVPLLACSAVFMRRLSYCTLGAKLNTRSLTLAALEWHSLNVEESSLRCAGTHKHREVENGVPGRGISFRSLPSLPPSENSSYPPNAFREYNALCP